MKSPSQWMLLLLLSSCRGGQCESLALDAATMKLNFFIGGLGYCGSRLALRLRQEFPSCTIAGCVRSQARKESIIDDSILHKAGIQVHVLDLDADYKGLDDDGIADLAQATHIVQTIAPLADFDRDPLLALHRSTLEDSKHLQWVGYLSSTGVYGNYDGEWVDENSDLLCQDAKSLARVKAETEWQKLEAILRQNQQKARIDCFRCGGIYGPGRGPLYSPFLALPPPEQEDGSDKVAPKYVNRILVDDICGAIVAAAEANADSSDPGKIYNLVDDDPAPRRDVMAEARRLVGATKERGPAKNTGRRRPASRNTGNKRCRNQRLKDDYNWEQIAPTYREGMSYLLQQQDLNM